jgi:hypothetical protein
LTYDILWFYDVLYMTDFPHLSPITLIQKLIFVHLSVFINWLSWSSWDKFLKINLDADLHLVVLIIIWFFISFFFQFVLFLITLRSTFLSGLHSKIRCAFSFIDSLLKPYTFSSSSLGGSKNNMSGNTYFWISILTAIRVRSGFSDQYV